MVDIPLAHYLPSTMTASHVFFSSGTQSYGEGYPKHQNSGGASSKESWEDEQNKLMVEYGFNRIQG